MFGKKTVFVVGAGCSAELGLPIGSELLDAMYKTLSNRDSPKFEQFYDAYIRCGIDGANVNFPLRLANFKAGLPTAPSIDQYLDFHREDPALVMLGKCALATEILYAEAACDLREEALQVLLPNWWLRWLFHMMMDGTLRGSPEKLFTNVSFICFNYDRIIEIFFRRAVQALSHCSPADAEAVVRDNLVIWHPYGTVGAPQLAGPGISGSAYAFSGKRIETLDVLVAAKGLRTFTEGAAETKSREEMTSAMIKAQQIVFLGFSYLEANMALLRTAPTATHAGQIFGTVYKTAQPNVHIARRRIIENLGSVQTGIDHRITLADLPASEFVSQYGAALRS
ncbi:hypothetical protein [Sphingomonas agri]|uniref:hypothetical protein n=1 Tax=Sphingomonas agri TaxID=1813878 RepID=UPI00311FF84B